MKMAVCWHWLGLGAIAIWVVERHWEELTGKF